MKKYQAKNTPSFSNYYHCCSTAEGETISVEYLRYILHGYTVFLMWYYLYYGWPLTFPLCKIVKCNFIVTNKRMMIGKPYWYHTITYNQQRIRNTHVSIFFSAFFPVFPYSHHIPTTPSSNQEPPHLLPHLLVRISSVVHWPARPGSHLLNSAEWRWLSFGLSWLYVCFFVCLVLW